MKIAYLSSSEVPSHTANSVQVMRMCNALAQNGHDVVLVARRGRATVVNDHTEYGVPASFRIAKCRWPLVGAAGALVYALQVATIVRSWIRPDLLYARNLPSLAVLARFGTPMILEAHTPPDAVRRLLAASVLGRQSFRRLIVTSDALRGECQRLFPCLPSDRILVARNAADPDGASQPSEVSGHQPLRADRLQVGYVGNLYEGKGMEVIAPLAARSREFDFHVIGGTAVEVRAWRRRTAEIPNLRLHGFVPPASTSAYCQAMDVLLAPVQSRVIAAGGRQEDARWMSPLKIFEYMAAGRPMVASDLPALREVLHDGVNAILVAPDDVTAWEGALQRLKDKALRRHLGQNALRLLTTSFTWSARATTVLAGDEALWSPMNGRASAVRFTDEDRLKRGA